MLDLLIFLAVLALIIHLWRYLAVGLGCLLILLITVLLFLCLFGLL